MILKNLMERQFPVNSVVPAVIISLNFSIQAGKPKEFWLRI